MSGKILVEMGCKWRSLKLFGTPFGQHLELQNVDHFLINRVKAKLRYWSSTQLSLPSRTLIVNQALMSSVWYFIGVWVGSKKFWERFKFCFATTFGHAHKMRQDPVLARMTVCCLKILEV